MNSFPAQSIQDRLTNWWNFGDQKTPCLMGSVLDGALPDTGDIERFWSDEEFILRRKLAEIRQTTWYGVSVPFHYVDQGSSAMAGVLGCRMESLDQETVWAHPVLDRIEELAEVSFSPDNPLYQRIRRITAASCACARGHHMVAPFAMEGLCDLMAALYGLEPFLMDVISEPELMKSTLQHLKESWLRAWTDIHSVIQTTGNPGGIGWAGIWAPGTTFPLQEDVCYSISPASFRDLCIPYLHDLVGAMDCAFFHLDGIGSINHLPYLLEIPALKAIQWQPGAGHERLSDWYGLIESVLHARKSVQLFGKAEEVGPLVKAVGARGLLVTVTDATHDNMQRLLDSYPQ